MAIKRGGVSSTKKQITPDYQSYGLDTDFQSWGTPSSTSSSSSGGWGSSDSNDWDTSGFSPSSSSSPWNTPSTPKSRGNRAFSFGRTSNDNEDYESNWNPRDSYSESDDDFASSFSSGSWGSTRSKYGDLRGSRYGNGGRGGNRRAKDVFRENVLIGDQVKRTISNVLGYSSSPLKGKGREGAAGVLRREAREISRIFSDVLDSFRLW